MTLNNTLNFLLLSLNVTVSSFYDVMKDEKYLQTNLGLTKWKALIRNSSLQEHTCPEGFNVQQASFCETCSRVRLGIIGDDNDICRSPDSYIGFGGQGTSTCLNIPTPTLVSCGNLLRCDGNHHKEIQTFGYILVR